MPPIPVIRITLGADPITDIIGARVFSPGNIAVI